MGADYLRSRTPFHVNILMAGFDPESKECEMYVLDYLASMVKAPFAAHGYGGFFTTALMDRKYRKDMTREEAHDLMKECVREIHKRLSSICLISKFRSSMRKEFTTW